MSAYYNEIEPYAAQWLRNLMSKGLIPAGEVDERSITDVQADDLRGFVQCHFFAGIGGWPYALRLAGWPNARPVWTGSCPCQPYSVAGKQEGQADERDLWPVWDKLIAAVRPAVVFGEQVAAAIGKHWLDRVRVDLEAKGYTLGAAVLPACAVGAPHRRDRLWIVAHAAGGGFATDGRPQEAERNNGVGHIDLISEGSILANAGVGRRAGAGEGETELPRRTEIVRASDGALADGPDGLHETISARRHVGGYENGLSEDFDGRRDVGDSHIARPQRRQLYPECGNELSPWQTGVEWLIGADGKARRVEPSIRLLAHGVPARVGKLRAFGNAIVPQVAAAFIIASEAA